jgi:hypothetical protein
MSLQLKEALRAAGFSPRAASTLAWSGIIETPEDLLRLEWGDPSSKGAGLARDLRTLPSFGVKGLSEVQAFRAGAVPAAAGPPAACMVTVAFSAAQLAELDAYLARQPDPKPTRHEAIVSLVLAGIVA